MFPPGQPWHIKLAELITQSPRVCLDRFKMARIAWINLWSVLGINWAAEAREPDHTKTHNAALYVWLSCQGDPIFRGWRTGQKTNGTLGNAEHHKQTGSAQHNAATKGWWNEASPGMGVMHITVADYWDGVLWAPRNCLFSRDGPRLNFETSKRGE